MSRIDDLIADLHSEGTVDSQGGFTLDREKAREKMRQFQLADPREYLLHLIRAAHCQGATQIDIEVDADDTHLRFDGAVFTERDFEELYDALFGRAGDPAIAGRRHLALGLNAALGLDPRRISVHSGAARLTVVPEGEDDFGALESPIEGTWIHARDRIRFSNIFRFFQGLSGSLPEAALVRERCGFSATRVTLNGEPLLDGRAQIEAQVAAFHAVNLPSCWAYGGPTEPGKPGVVHIVAGGVKVTTIALPGAVGFVGVAGGAHLQTDVSQADVIRDTHFERVLERAREAQSGALSALITAGHADAFLDPDLVADRWRFIQADYGKPFANALQQRVHVQTLAGARVRLSDVDVSLPVEFVSFDFAERRAALGPLPDDLARLPVVSDDGAFAAAIAEAKVDRTPDLLAWIEGAEGERDFRRRRVDAVALEGTYGVRTRIASGDWHGEAGISLDAGRAWITWVLDGCALSSVRVDLKVPGLRVIISGPLTPTPDFKAPARDAAFEAATRVIGEAVERLMEGLAPDDWGRATALRWLTSAMQGHPGAQVVERLRGEFKAGKTAWLQALPTTDAALAQLPLFATMQGEFCSLARLHARITEHGSVDFVDPVVRGPRVDPPILSVSDAGRALLEVIFGDARLRSGSKRLGRARKRAAFEAREPRPVDLSFETATVVGEAVFDGGVVGIRQRGGGSERGWYPVRVQPFSRGRPLKVVTLALPLPGVVGAVDVGDRPLNARYDGLQDSARNWLLGQLIAHLDALFCPGMRIGPVRRFWRALLDLWVPTAAHFTAWSRWDDPDAYRAALRLWWSAGNAKIEASLADWGVDDIPAAPADPLREAILAPMFAAAGSLAARFEAAYPRLSTLQIFRAFDGPDASINSVMAGVEAEGVVLHASRPSVFPEGFGGVMLKTEHAQLERLHRLVGPDALARATTWKLESALAHAVAAAPRDPGQLPDGTRGIVPIEDGEIGLRVPFNAGRSSRVHVILAGRVVSVLAPVTKVPIVGRVTPSEDARMVLVRGRLDVDGLTKVRVNDQAKRAVDAAIRAVMDAPANPERDRLLVGVLGARAQGVTQRGLMRNDPVARALSKMPLFARLVGPPVSAQDLINQRRSRKPLWVTPNADAPPPSDLSNWVLVLDPATRVALKHLFSTPIADYAEALAERAAAVAMAERPIVPWTLPAAIHVVEVSDGPIRALVGHGLPTDRLIVLRDGRMLGQTQLELGVRGVGGMVDDAALPPTQEWTSDPRLRRLRRLVASAVPALGAQLCTADRLAARALIWDLLRRAWPSVAWVGLYRWLHAVHTADTAQRLYHDALQAAAQGTHYLLDRILTQTADQCPYSTAALMRTFGMPASSGGDRILRAAVGGEWPLDGDPGMAPLTRLADRLGPLGVAPWLPTADGGWLSMAEVAHMSTVPLGAQLATSDAELVTAVLTAWTAIRADEQRRAAKQERAHAEARRQAEQARLTEQFERRQAELARAHAEIERRRAAALKIEPIAEPVAAPIAEPIVKPIEERPSKPEPPAKADAPRAPEAQPPSTPKRTPEDQLIGRVIGHLGAVQAEHPRLLADVNLGRLAAQQTGPLAVADGHVFAINMRHPTAVAALGGDRVAEVMVVAAAYGALNLWLIEITDAHELLFAEHLLRLAARVSNGEAARD